MDEIENQPAPAQDPHEAQRNWQQLLDEAAHKVMDGTLQAAGGYGAKVVIDKVRDHRHPPAEPPAQGTGTGDSSPS